MKKAIKQSVLVFWVNMITVILLLAILASLGVTVLNSKAADQMNEDRFLLSENATLFMNASNYLTSEIRAYSATGDKMHSENYMRSIEQTKEREAALEAMIAVGVSAEEKAKLDEMMAISNELVPIEKQAIAFGEQGKLKEAVQSVLGVAYNEKITKIGELKREFLALLFARTSEEVNKGVVATRMLEMQTIILVLVIIVLRFYSYYIIRKKVINPIIAVEKEMRHIAQGDLSSTFDLHPDTSEIGMLIDSILSTKSQLQKYIFDISDKLTQMSNKDFSISVDIDYIGDFSPIKESLNHISESLSAALNNIESTASMVGSGSTQVSIGAQSVANGTALQAVAIEEVSATITQIANQVQQTAEGSEMATTLANAAGVQLGKSNDQLKGMLVAMNEISNASGEIGKIIKTIEDIAFQTNILALNAAVEAARAGTAGKGFAVVADEVRNLANKSAEASKNTSIMIANSLNTIKSGAKIATEASNTFVQVMAKAGKSAEAMGDISVASKEQAQAISQLTQSIEQISGVIQTNSANSEESAAASEELSQQADTLHNLVHEFKLLT